MSGYGPLRLGGGSKGNPSTLRYGRGLLSRIGHPVSVIGQRSLADSIPIDGTIPFFSAAAAEDQNLPSTSMKKLDDIVVGRVKSTMALKRRIALETVNSHFAAVGIVKQKMALKFSSVDQSECRVVLRTKRGKEIVADLSVFSAKDLQAVLESVVFRFRRFSRVITAASHSCVHKGVLDSLLNVAASYADMEVRRYFSVQPVELVLLPSLTSWIDQFSQGLHRLTLPLPDRQFPALSAALLPAIGRCQQLRHLDLLFHMPLSLASLQMLAQLMNSVSIGDVSAVQQLANYPPADFATSFTEILTTFAHLHTLHLVGATPLALNYPSTATRRTLTISPAWLTFITQPAFKAVLDQMDASFELAMEYLPLSDGDLQLLSQVLEEQLPPTASIHVSELMRSSWLLSPMTEALANWLLLVKHTGRQVQISARRPLPSEEQLASALEELPTVGMVESKLVTEDCQLVFRFASGGRLTVKCMSAEDRVNAAFEEDFANNNNNNTMMGVIIIQQFGEDGGDN